MLLIYLLFRTADFLNTEKEQVMELIVAKHAVDSVPIPVIGIEPVLESACRELASRELQAF